MFPNINSSQSPTQHLLSANSNNGRGEIAYRKKENQSTQRLAQTTFQFPTNCSVYETTTYDTNLGFTSTNRDVSEAQGESIAQEWAQSVFESTSDNTYYVCAYTIDKRVSKEEEESTAEPFAKQANVFCLQDVGTEDRPLIRALYDRKFEICHTEFEDGTFNAAIAIDKSRFSDIQNHSDIIKINQDETKDVAIVSANDSKTGEKVVFVSLNPPAFRFYKSISPEEKDNTTLYFKEVAKRIEALAPSKIQIIGANMNNNPETWSAPFDSLTNINFKLLRGKKPIDKRLDEINYIFSRVVTSFWEKIKSIFCQTVTYKTEITNDILPPWNLNNNIMEHLAIFAIVKHETVDSKIEQLWKSFKSFF